MPIYEYRCSDCGYQNEYLQKVYEPLMTLCPSCGQEAFRKLLSVAGFQLKGSGWYATDFKGNGAKPAAKPDKTEAKQEAAPSPESTPACGQSASPACAAN